jgi:hypothetical protein
LYLYLYSRGFVTVGVGHLLASVEKAQQLSFVDGLGKLVSKDVIPIDFDTMPRQETNHTASYCQSSSTLALLDDAINH